MPASRAIIDVEICVQDERDVTNFPHCLLRSSLSLRTGVLRLRPAALDGDDLRAAPLEERRAKLRLLVSHVPGSRIVMCDEYDGDGQAFFDLVSSHDLEGMVSKRKGSRYWSGPAAGTKPSAGPLQQCR